MALYSDLDRGSDLEAATDERRAPVSVAGVEGRIFVFGKRISRIVKNERFFAPRNWCFRT